MNLSDLKNLNIPKSPGVYIFRQKGKIFYIGKATSLRDRVKSYFGKDLIRTRGMLIIDMIAKADTLEWQGTDSVLEALILEAELIKKHQPYYNTREKDDKSWNYIVITKEKLPKVLTVRGKVLEEYKGDKFGPYTHGSQLREALKIIRRIFPFLDDKNKNYIEFYRQIFLAPDVSDRDLYLKNIRNIKLFLQGKKKKVILGLKKDMKTYAKNREFEKANEMKRQIFALQHINDIALLKLEPNSHSLETKYRIESYDIAHMSGRNMVGVMTVVEGGMAAKSEYRKFKIRTQEKANDTGALAEVIGRRLVHTEWRYPNLIVVDGGKGQLNAINKTLEEAGVMMPVVSVVKDERHRPKNILGLSDKEQESAILLANSESHRFAIAYHKNMRNKNFLPGKIKKKK